MDPLPVTGQSRAARPTAPEMSLPSPALPAAGRPAAGRPAAGRPAVPVAVPATLAGGTVLAQVAYPLLDGAALRAATIATVVLFAGASLTHAAARWGLPAAARLAVVAGGIGLLAEAVGVATGFPFGDYRYAGTLGPDLLGVPVVVPLAWTMMAYPCLLLGRRLSAGNDTGGAARLRAVALGAIALAAWDLALDPQMVAAGHWTWARPTPALPGVPGIPLTNFAGWLLVALVMVAALDAALPRTAGATGEAVPAALLAWTWAGSVIGNVAFFGRPAVGAWVGVALGVTVLPYLADLWRSWR